MSKKWYVIQTYSGYENKVKEALLQRIKEHGKESAFGEILIPTETVQETRGNGKQRVRQRTSLPGYIFVEMEMTEEAWHLVKDTPRSLNSSATSVRRKCVRRKSKSSAAASSKAP